MNLNDLILDNRPLTVGRRIGRGGEGDIYELQGDPSSALKLYTIPDPKSREAKVAAMVAGDLASKSALASFPNGVVRSRRGDFLGFRMKLVRDHKALHELYAPGPRKHHFPQADYKFLVRAAGNIARAVASVHRSGCVIGDINHSGALISKQATASLIDADSFQFSTGAQTFFCKVGVPEYTPPELQGKALGSIMRTANHDCFGLAVIVFQLLFMGRHPFVGTVRTGDIPPLHEAIRDYRFVYTEARNVGMDQPPGTPTLGEFPLDIGHYFEAAFGQRTKEQRPTAADWVRVLDVLESALIGCGENKLHLYPRDSEECPWCFMEKQLGSVLFVPYVPGAKLVEGFDPGAAAFSIDTIWRQIAAVTIPPRSELVPRSMPAAMPTTKAATTSKWPFESTAVLRAVGFACAVGLLFVNPKLWLLSCGIAAVSYFWGRKDKTDNASSVRARLSEVESRWVTEVLAWQKRSGVDDFLQQQQHLKAAKEEYVGLDHQKRREIDSYRSQRRQRQLQAFLDGFEIRKAKIRGIGVAKQAALASFGVDTAADVSMAKVLGVPGIGRTIAEDMLKWRAMCERKFVYSEAQSSSDVQELNNINARFAAKGTALRRTLSAGPNNLSALAKRVRTAIAIEDPAVGRLGAERDALLDLLKTLGGSGPVTIDWDARASGVHPNRSPLSTTSQVAPPSYPAPPFRSSSRAGSSVPTRSCPRCGAGMTIRTARRGRNAGSSFWGCSRYPACRGTRNI